jgi:hypothetical protein
MLPETRLDLKISHPPKVAWGGLLSNGLVKAQNRHEVF